MKRYLSFSFLFVLLYIGIILSIRILWVSTTPYLLKKDFIKNDVNTVVLGPSHLECAWNDAIIPHSLNLCASGNSLGACYNKLKWVVEYNENSIDTVVLGCAINNFLYAKDVDIDPYYEEINSKLDYKSFFKLLNHKSSFWKMLLTSFPVFNRGGFRGGYNYLVRDKLDHPNLYDEVNRIMALEEKEGELSEDFFKKNCAYQVYYLRKIRDYCREKNKILVIVHAPLYKIPDMISDFGFTRLLLSELGDTQLLADYSRMVLPDTNYFGDLEHLNYRGAEYFSRYIAEHGLEAQQISEYIRLKYNK